MGGASRLPFRTAMAHGNFSDLGALALIILGVQCVWFTDSLFENIGPFKPTLSSPSSPETSALYQVIGGLLLIIGLTLSGVKWNPANGKMAGLGCFSCSA